MSPQYVSMPEQGRDSSTETLPRSHSSSVSDSQDAPGAPVEAREPNPWASEHDGEHLTYGRQSQHLSTLRHNEAARGHQKRASRESLIIRSRPSRSLSPSNSSGSHGEGSDAVLHTEIPLRFVENLGRKALAREIESLQRLASLQHSDTDLDSAEDTSAPIRRWKVLHEVQCLNTKRWTYYLDEPELENDADLMHLHWQGNRQIINVKAWIRKQKQPFIVYRQYYCVHERKEFSVPSEMVRISSRKLDDAVTSWLAASPGLIIYSNKGVYTNNELRAPYLCFYHFRPEARHLLSASGSSSQESLSLLEYLDTSTAAIAQEAEEMFAAGKVNAKLMPYLFKPGALVCFEDSGDPVVCEQTSLLNVFSDPGEFQRIFFELSTVKIAFDGKFRLLRPFKHRVDFGAARDEPVYIADLPVQPLSFISSKRRTELNRRGQTFMRCQKQLYVTYPGKGGHHDFVCSHRTLPDQGMRLRITNDRTGRHEVHG